MYFFIYLFINQCGLIDYYFMQWVKNLLLSFFNDHVAPDWARENAFELALMTL